MTDPVVGAGSPEARDAALRHTERAGPGRAGDSRQTAGAKEGNAFAALLAQALVGAAAEPKTAPAAPKAGSVPSGQELRLSAHAAQRLQAAGVAFNANERGALERAVSRVAAKGGRECLALTTRAAYIVHVPSGTVVTAVSGERMQEGVFTGIDSAVFALDTGPDRS